MNKMDDSVYLTKKLSQEELNNEFLDACDRGHYKVVTDLYDKFHYNFKRAQAIYTDEYRKKQWGVNYDIYLTKETIKKGVSLSLKNNHKRSIRFWRKENWIGINK